MPGAILNPFRVLLLVLLLVLAGCHREPPPPEPVPVQGKVVCGSKPGIGVLVKFWPQGKKLKPIETACGEKGEFSLSCPPGSYKVTAWLPPRASAGPDPSGGKVAAPPRTDPVSVVIPDKYGRPDDTPLSVEVGESGNGRVVLTIPK